jgi:hypothetical protein
MSRLFSNTTVTRRRLRYGPGARRIEGGAFQRPHEDAEDQDQADRDRREVDRAADDRGARLFGLHGCALGL